MYLNYKLKGKTPYEATVPAGTSFKVVISKENYKNWNETITVNDQVDKAIRLKTISKSKNRPWYIASAVIVSGGVIAYFATQQGNGTNGSINWPQPPTRPN